MTADELNKIISNYKQNLLRVAKNFQNADSLPQSQEQVNVFLDNLQNFIDKDIVTIDEQAEEYLNFMTENPKLGSLKIQANTAKQTIPIANALVEISKNFNGIKRIFYTLRTDSSGIIDGILLPAPDKALSQMPSGKKPFSNYDVHVEHPGYNDKNYVGVLIFDGIKSIQQVEMVPTF